MVKKKLNVLVLMGGKTPEFDVSLASGIQVVKHLSKRKYETTPIVISKDGKIWHLTSRQTILSLENPITDNPDSHDLVLPIRKDLRSISQVPNTPDIVFIAMHGPFGEDGTIQGLLELTGTPFTGSGVLASAVCMDKLFFRKILETEKMPIPKYIAVKKGQKTGIIQKTLGKLPYFVKPNNQGSSVGSSLIKSKQDLPKALRLAWKYSDIALVDEYIKGRELTCAVLGNNKPRALPVVEIIPKAEFFSYKAKYQEGQAEEVVPAHIPKVISKQVQELAIKTHLTLGCRGFSRTDFLLKGKKVYILEINTIPGLTPNSLLPKAATAAGISYSKLLDTIIKYATKK